jgi:hypothetical protein
VTRLWGGRFSKDPAAEAIAFTSSIGFDVRLVHLDCAVLAAHGRALARAGVLSDEEAVSAADALKDVAEDIASGDFPVSPTDEDIHSAVERALLERLPEAAPKIRAGLSRNDRIASAFRLWVIDAAGDITARLGFADVKSVMSGAGSALMGIGSARGDNRAVEAAESAISSPLLEQSMDGARGVLLSIAGGSDLGLFEINDAAQLVTDAAHPDANIIFGAVIDDALGDEVRVTVIAAGFDGGAPAYRPVEARPARTSHGQHSQPKEPAPQERQAPPPPRRVLFDDVDVPDFLKNGA